MFTPGFQTYSLSASFLSVLIFLNVFLRSLGFAESYFAQYFLGSGIRLGDEYSRFKRHCPLFLLTCPPIDFIYTTLITPLLLSFLFIYTQDDTWGPEGGPCFGPWFCCGSKYNATTCNATLLALCQPACAADADTQTVMGGIHPRSKKPVGDRLAAAAFNTVYGGDKAYTGPTLSSCGLSSEAGQENLDIQFNTTLLRGDTLTLQPIFPYVVLPGRNAGTAGGSQLWVQTNASQFCMEAQQALNSSGQPIPNMQVCPTWAGGDGTTLHLNGFLDNGWVQLNFTQLSDSSIRVDLSPLNGTQPTAVRYAW
jgi:hypothetical protein